MRQKSPFDLTEKVALVTGAGRGIGRAIVFGLARAGAHAVVISRRREQAEQVSDMVRQEGMSSSWLTCDVSDPAEVWKTIATASDEFGRIDILVNNAGITKRIPTTEFGREDLRQIMEVNFGGAFYCCQAVAKIMMQQKRGNIINIGSFAGLVGIGRGNAVYAASKGALFALTRDLACEWGPRGIRVNAIAPFWIRTDMIAPVLENDELMGRILTSIPLGRIGVPDDVAGTVVFLASDASALITGQVLVLDGGLSATFMPPGESSRVAPN